MNQDSYPQMYKSAVPSMSKKSSRLRSLFGVLPPTFHVARNTLKQKQRILNLNLTSNERMKQRNQLYIAFVITLQHKREISTRRDKKLYVVEKRGIITYYIRSDIQAGGLLRPEQRNLKPTYLDKQRLSQTSSA